MITSYISQSRNYLEPSGLIGNGIADDSAAINAALATGATVFLPRPASFYKTSSPLVFSNVIGQRLIGNDPATIIGPATNIDAIHLGARSQQVENLNLSCSGGRGIVIPQYYPYWKILNVLIGFSSTAIENKVVNPGMGEPQGTDAGGILNCQITDCDIGYLAYGNKDQTPVIATSIGACGIGIKVDADGGACMIGGVMGGNDTAVLVEEGVFSGSSIHFEVSADYDLDVGTNANASLCSCVFVASPTPSFRAATNARIDLFGYGAGSGAGRVNGTGQIRTWGLYPGAVSVDYNGSFNFNAGQYSIVDTLPAAASGYAGAFMAVVGANEFTLYYCAKTGASTYAWKEIGA